MALKLLLLLIATVVSQGVAEVFHVTPTLPATQPCPPPCYTLDQYAQNDTLLEGYINITLIFVSGQHVLSHNLSISGVDQLSMQVETNATCNVHRNDVSITLKQAQICLNISTHVKICDITIKSSLDHQTLEISGPTEDLLLLHLTLGSMILKVQQVLSVHVSECRGTLSTFQFGDVANISVTNMNISGNRSIFSEGIRINSQARISPSLICIIQNSYITNYQYGISWTSVYTVNQTSLLITNTLFEQNRNGVVLIGQSQGEIIFTNTYFIKNAIGFFISLFKGRTIITNTQVIESTYAVLAYQISNLTIQNSTIFDCESFGILLTDTDNASIFDSRVTNNRAGITSIQSAVHIWNTSIDVNAFGMIVIPAAADLRIVSAINLIQNCTFSSNNVSGLTLVNSYENVFIQDSSFQRNRGTSLLAYQSTFELMGETVFRDNTANRGGGLALYNSTVIFGPGSNTQFINNTAREYGGAIYIVSLPSVLPAILIGFESLQENLVVALTTTSGLLRQTCFFSVSDSDAKINFMGNTATLGGLDIYGATVYTNVCSLRKEIFVFHNISNAFQVTSEPSRVCFCNNDNPQCTSTTFLVINETSYPGELLSVSAVLTGYNFGRVAGSVYTHVVGRDYREVISESQHIQFASLQLCTKLQYNIISQQNQTSFVLLALTAQDRFTPEMNDFETSLHDANSDRCKNLTQPCTALLTSPVYINVTIEECPLGFILNKTIGMCDCDQTIGNLMHSDGTPLTCTIQNRTGYITRKGTIWVGVDTQLNNTDIYYWHRNCPRDYCNRSEILVDLRHPDVQCRLNRDGVLCGSCQSGYSLQLGSNECAQCNNNTISLLIIFAILGILLVVLITTLDLTVANGTVNGLIFYANVVWINNAVLFPTRDRLELGYYIITVPIAWINLDFGIETCFSERLDQLTKSGLQFVFPVYIWCIAGLIILIAHYSTRATKLFGKNSVAVLATLFLLSYGKLFRNILDVFIHADVTDSQGEIRTVWALDGNVEYNKVEHIVLILVSTFFLLILLPFTLMLLLVPFLTAKSNYKLLDWINRLKPFFDTYYGPFKHRKRYQVWTGILLVSRVVILITFASLPTGDPYVNMLLIIVMSTLLLVYTTIVGLLYKKLYISLLEVSYLVNLILLGGAFYQTSPRISLLDSEQPNPVPIISVCCVLIQFAGIVLFHVVRRILSSKKIQECLKHEPKQVEIDLEDNKPTAHVIDTNELYDSSRYRESLLF